MSTVAETRGRRSRHRFTDRFEEQSVRLALDGGRSVTALAHELDLVGSALGNWVRQAPAGQAPGRLA